MFAKLPHCSTEGQSLATARLFQCESDNLKEEPVEPLDCKNQERLYWQTAFPVYSEGCLVHIATAAGSKLSKLITGQQILLKASWPRRVHRGQIQASRAFFFFFFLPQLHVHRLQPGGWRCQDQVPKQDGPADHLWCHAGKRLPEKEVIDHRSTTATNWQSPAAFWSISFYWKEHRFSLK